MNPLPPNADELVSAYLDGQAAPDEVIIVESSPELMERVQSMRSIADLVGQPATPPAAQKEAHLSAALDAFDALFSAEATETTPLAATAPTSPAPLAAVPAAPQPSVVTPVVEAVAAEPITPDGVTSLAAARERRRPRRFNPGVIAAAAVVLLFVALAAFGLGGGDNALDVASTVAEGDAASITSSQAMSDDDAMADEESSSALSEIAPSPTAGAAAAAPQAAAADSVEDAMEAEEEAMDDEEAMSDSMDDAAAEAPEADFDESSNDAGADAGSLDAEPLRLFGEFGDQDELRLELKQLPIDDVAARVDPPDPGLFDSCQLAVPELADIETPTLVGDAFVAGELVEIHQIVDGDDITFILVDPAAGCSVLPETP